MPLEDVLASLAKLDKSSNLVVGVLWMKSSRDGR